MISTYPKFNSAKRKYHVYTVEKLNINTVVEYQFQCSQFHRVVRCGTDGTEGTDV